jgi:hypothetical protein
MFSSTRCLNRTPGRTNDGSGNNSAYRRLHASRLSSAPHTTSASGTCSITSTSVLGNSVAIRDAIEEQLEHIFSGSKTPQQGLDEAVAKGSEILRKFAAQGERTDR